MKLDNNRGGYSDSYGGLISAEEAKHLTVKGKEDQKLGRLNQLSQAIKCATSSGLSSTTEYATEAEVKVFLSLGYRITYVDKKRPNIVKISWGEESSLEDNPQT